MAEQTTQVEEKALDRAEQTAPTTRDKDRYVTPRVDIHEEGDDLIVVADVPGVGPEQLDVNVEDDLLTITGHPTEETAGDFVWREFERVGYYRQFRLGERVDRERIQADLKNGVLTLRLPKAESAKPRRIAVSIA